MAISEETIGTNVLNAWLATRCGELAARKHPVTPEQSIAACFLQEQPALGQITAPFDGYVEHMLRVSSVSMRASCAAILSCAVANCANSARISVSFSAWLSLLRSGGDVTQRLESTRL